MRREDVAPEGLDNLHSGAEAVDEARAEIDGLLARTEALEAETESARRQLHSRDLVTENSLVLTLSVPSAARQTVNCAMAVSRSRGAVFPPKLQLPMEYRIYPFPHSSARWSTWGWEP